MNPEPIGKYIAHIEYSDDYHTCRDHKQREWREMYQEWDNT